MVDYELFRKLSFELNSHSPILLGYRLVCEKLSLEIEGATLKELVERSASLGINISSEDTILSKRSRTKLNESFMLDRVFPEDLNLFKKYWAESSH